MSRTAKQAVDDYYKHKAKYDALSDIELVREIHGCEGEHHIQLFTKDFLATRSRIQTKLHIA